MVTSLLQTKEMTAICEPGKTMERFGDQSKKGEGHNQTQLHGWQQILCKLN